MTRLSPVLLLIGLTVLITTACQKQNLITYNADNNIYFNYVASLEPTVYTDSLAVTFAFSDSSVTDTVIGIPVSVTGVASTQDRTYLVTVDPASTVVASTDYELPSSFVLRAGQTADTIRVALKRTAAIKAMPRFLTLRLAPNDQFKTQLKVRSRQANDRNNIQPGDTTYMQTFKLIVSDRLAAGPYWTNEYSYYFGDFSEKKVRLMNQIIGMPLNFWSIDQYSSQEQQANTIYYGGFTFRYLSDQAYQGNTIFEADGTTPMTMGYYFQ